MKKPLLWILLLVGVPTGLYAGYLAWWNAVFYTVERTDVNPSPDPLDQLNLVDDRLEDKTPKFDPEMVDRRDYDGWQINNSAAVIRLDCPDIRPDRESEMTQLYASYANAIQQAQKRGLVLLPSANMLDGIAKQFDDGLYAALDLACYRGDNGFSPSAIGFVENTLSKLPDNSPARAFLAAALQLAGRTAKIGEDQQFAAANWIAAFEADPMRSKPISFYTWSDELRQAWKFFRFLQHSFEQDDLGIPLDLAAVIAEDKALGDAYQELINFYSTLTNPPDRLDLSQLTGSGSDLRALAAKHSVQQAAVAVLPPSTSRETELFNRIFVRGGASQTNLMIELIRQIRSGTVDLTPRDDSGWYDHQVYSLETLVLPELGAESQKLLLTSKYKRRLIQAFQALITKRRETHARQLALTEAAMAMPPQQIKPRLRIEPCATFYLRTARSYAFLESFLQATIGNDALSQIHGLREAGQRELDLRSELAATKELFYGFHLIACEDIGLLPQLTNEDSVDTDSAYAAAADWLSHLDHPDLSMDTRVSVPVLNDLETDATRLWATIGVRLAKLKASYARGPRIRENDESEWQDVETYRMGDETYVIIVDEFAEFSLKGRQVLSRIELRTICDQHQTKSAIVQALSAM